MSHAFRPFATVSQAGRPSLTPANPSRTPNNNYRLTLAHRITRRLASGTNRVTSARRPSPLIRPGDSSDEGIIKLEPGATQNAEVDQLDDSEMDDNMAADHESSNGEMENDEAVDEQMDALETEDDNSTYENFENDVSDSPETSDDENLEETSDDEEELARDPVATDAWPLDPSRKAILSLERLQDQQNNPFNVDHISYTARDVTMAALHSVRFLELLGDGPVDPKRIGINYVGYLFPADPSNEDNYRRDFSALVAKLERNAIMFPKKEVVEKALREYHKAGCKLNGIHDGVAPVRALRDLVEDRLDDLRFEVDELEQIRDECNEVVKEMNRVISAVTAVKQDLADTGSTSLKRWNELRKMGGWSSMAASRGGNEISPDDIANVVRDFETYLKPYQRLLGMTVHLEDDLDDAINSLRNSRV